MPSNCASTAPVTIDGVDYFSYVLDGQSGGLAAAFRFSSCLCWIITS